MSTELIDLIGGMSHCCGAPMYFDQGICTECKEHCSDSCEDCGTSDEKIEGGLCARCMWLMKN